MAVGDVAPACYSPLMVRWSLLLVLGVGACSPSSLVQTAHQGELAELRSEIAAARERGELDEGATRDLARAVAARELASSADDAAVARVRELRSCVSALRSELAERAEGTDAGAAAANLALLEAGRADAEDLFEAHRSARDPNWRAVAARAAMGADHADYRRASFVHGDLRVRRAALHAAAAKPQAGDLEAALEAARLDPDPLVRSLGIRVAGSIGGVKAVNALRDLWERAEAETRQVIIDGWAMPKSYQSGGKERIVWVMETQRGLPAVVAAARLVGAEQAHQAAAVALLRRAVSFGPVDEQRLAVLIGPTNTLHADVLKLSESEDPHAAVLAAAALGRLPKYTDVARKRLRELSKHKTANIARQARAALVMLGDQSLVPLLQKEIQSKAQERRRQAALDLVRLGQFADAAGVLSDPVASVRNKTACAILNAP